MSMKRFARGLLFGTAILLLYPLLFPAGTTAQESREWEAISTEPLFALSGSLGTPFRQPTDVAVGPKGRIFVMDGLNSRVAVFDQGGSFLYGFGSRGQGAGQMLLPVGIGISTTGEVFVADTGNHRIQVFRPDGGYLRSFPLITKEKADPTDVYPSPYRGLCYICDNDNHQVHVHDAESGAHLESWGGRGKNLGQFRYPATITSDRKNDIYVVDVMNARVQTFDSMGNAAREVVTWGISAGSLFRPKGVAVDGERRIFVSDSYRGTIQVFSSKGDFIGFVADEGGRVRNFETPTNIVLNETGRLLVVETRANRVAVLRVLP